MEVQTLQVMVEVVGSLLSGPSGLLMLSKLAMMLSKLWLVNQTTITCRLINMHNQLILMLSQLFEMNVSKIVFH